MASDLKSHVTPVVILPQQLDSPDGSEATDTLIDLSFPTNYVITFKAYFRFKFC
jgi:hypothetical protein